MRFTRVLSIIIVVGLSGVLQLKAQIATEPQIPTNPFVVIISRPQLFGIGDKYKAKIVLCKYDSSFKGIITVDGNSIKVTNGVGQYETMVYKAGENVKQVSIVKEGVGSAQERMYKDELIYFGTKNRSVIMADKMNMLFTGLDNPISVSVPGYRPDQLLVNSSDSSIRPNTKSGTGHYFISPKIGFRGIIKVNVSVKTEDGTKPMGSMDYRVRPIPKPEILLGSKTGGSISRNELLTISFVAAGLGESFPFEGLNFTVKSYTLVYTPVKGDRKVFDVVGNRISPEIKEAFKSVNPGDMLFFTKVIALGPAGEKYVNGPAFEVKE